VSTLSRWAHGGREYLIGRIGADGLACLEARTGKELWTAPIAVHTGGRGLGPGGITVVGDRLLAYENLTPGAKGETAKGAISAFSLDPAAAPRRLWQVEGGAHGESIPVVVHGKYVFSADLRVIDLATGKVLGQAQGITPANGGYMQVIEDLVLVRRDGTHGGISCGFFKVAPDGAVRALNAEEWRPAPGGGTTSYHHPIYYPMVDGRMFLRQQDGVYCWDLRAKRGG
jgi:outer membrane protein assembly factor BamB